MIVRAFFRRPLIAQFGILLSVLLSLGVGAIALVLESLAQSQALEQARVTASLVEAVGSWSSRYHGIWVLNDPTDSTFQVGDFMDEKTACAAPAPDVGDKIAILSGLRSAKDLGGSWHRKTPSSVQRELSDELAKLVNGASSARFRVTSDRVFDARNTPDSFELTAINHLRAADGAATEYHEIAGGRLVYARRLVAGATCMRCHGAPEKAPAAIRAKLSEGWGVKEGGFAGIVSVSVPVRAPDVGNLFARMNAMTWSVIVALVVTCLALLVWMQSSVIGTAETLKDYIQRILEAKVGVQAARVDLDLEESTSSNEMHKLSLGIKALYRALRLVQADRI